MFAFAGFEVAPMVAGRTKNPQRDFPRAMALSAIVIVGIYMIGTIAVNTLVPAGKTDIVAGIMQAMKSGAETLGAPWLLPLMAVCLFSMAGIPPLVGFYAKLAVLQALVASGQTIYIAMAVFAVIMSLIGAFYYLRVVKVMYFDAPLTATNVSAPVDVRVVLTINGALVLVLGLLPGGLMALCADAVVRALAT